MSHHKDIMTRPWRPHGKAVRQLTPAAVALSAARAAARLRLDQTGAGLNVHARTVRRWEIGETHPSSAEWSRIVAFFAAYAPQAACDLAAAAGVPSPIAEPAPVDLRGIEAAITRAADRLDVAPRRVRAALREIAAAVASAHGSLEDLVRASQDDDASRNDSGAAPARASS